MKGRTMWLVVCLMLVYVVGVDAYTITLNSGDSLESIFQDFLDADTILAPADTFPGNFALWGDKVLIGAGSGLTVFKFDPDGPTDNVFTVTASGNVTISGVTIDAVGAYSGIFAGGSVTIEDVAFPGAEVGVWIDEIGELNGGADVCFVGCRYGIDNYGTLDFDGGEDGAYFYNNWIGIQNRAGGYRTVVHTIFDGDSISIKGNGIPGVGDFIRNNIFQNTKYNAIDLRLTAADTLDPGVPFVFSIINNTADSVGNNFVWLEYITDIDISNNIIAETHCGIASNMFVTLNSYNCFYNISGDIYWMVESSDTMVVNPQFGNSSFFLMETSPCIDAGNPDSTYNDPDGTRNDIGCYGGPLGWWNGFVGDYIPAMVVDPGVPPKETGFSVYPNPSNTAFCFSMPEPQIITIYDMRGRMVWTSERTTRVVWDGVDDSGKPVAGGVYFCRTSAGEFMRVILMK